MKTILMSDAFVVILTLGSGLVGLGLFTAFLMFLTVREGRRDRRYWGERFTAMEQYSQTLIRQGQNRIDQVHRAIEKQSEDFQDAIQSTMERQRSDNRRFRRLYLREARLWREQVRAFRQQMADMQVLIRMLLERFDRGKEQGPAAG